jgi:hypothetical protein
MKSKWNCAGWYSGTSIREVVGSNLGLDIWSPDWDLSCFSSVPQEIAGVVPRQGRDCLFPNPLQLIIHWLSYSATLLSLR